MRQLALIPAPDVETRLIDTLHLEHHKPRSALSSYWATAERGPHRPHIAGALAAMGPPGSHSVVAKILYSLPDQKQIYVQQKKTLPVVRYNS